MSDFEAVVGELMDRMDEYRAARKAYRKCCAECHHSPAYYCRTQERACEDARAAISKAFADAVRAAVTEGAA